MQLSFLILRAAQPLRLSRIVLPGGPSWSKAVDWRTAVRSTDATRDTRGDEVAYAAGWISAGWWKTRGLDETLRPVCMQK
jgi:hypothetical protein